MNLAHQDDQNLDKTHLEIAREIYVLGSYGHWAMMESKVQF